MPFGLACSNTCCRKYHFSTWYEYDEEFYSCMVGDFLSEKARQDGWRCIKCDAGPIMGWFCSDACEASEDGDKVRSWAARENKAAQEEWLPPTLWQRVKKWFRGNLGI